MFNHTRMPAAKHRTHSVKQTSSRDMPRDKISHDVELSKMFNNADELSSRLAASIINSLDPVELTEQEELDIFGQRGVWLNKRDAVKAAASDYDSEKENLNIDPNPTIIRKKPSKKLEYIQSLYIKYLRPPTPPANGDVVIVQESDILLSPPPPLILRQEPTRPRTPEPIVYREEPPTPPEPLAPIHISIPAQKMTPPPRKVIIEKMPTIPAKPAPILVERWLPYNQPKRRVVFKPASPPPPHSGLESPHNVIIEWETPDVSLKKEFKCLGVHSADPAEYRKTFGSTLMKASELPSFVNEFKQPSGVTLAAECAQRGSPMLVGDSEALNILKTLNVDLNSHEGDLVVENFRGFDSLEIAAAQVIQASQCFAVVNSSVAVKSAFNSASFVALNDIIAQIFEKVDQQSTGRISLEEARLIFLRLNKHLNQKLDEKDIQNYFGNLSAKNANFLNLEEFKVAFFKLQWNTTESNDS